MYICIYDSFLYMADLPAAFGSHDDTSHRSVRQVEIHKGDLSVAAIDTERRSHPATGHRGIPMAGFQWLG